MTAGGTKPGGGIVVAAARENVGDLIMGRKKPLRVARRLEPLHDPLSSSGRLVGILRPVVEAFVLPVLDAGHDRARLRRRRPAPNGTSGDTLGRQVRQPVVDSRMWPGLCGRFFEIFLSKTTSYAAEGKRLSSSAAPDGDSGEAPGPGGRPRQAGDLSRLRDDVECVAHRRRARPAAKDRHSRRSKTVSGNRTTPPSPP